VAEIYKSEAGKQAVEARYRDVLQRWPVPNRHVVVPTCQGDTFVVVSGESHTMPVQLILGGNDALLRSTETRDRMKRWAPNLQLTYLENEGHVLPPQTAAISTFLQAVAS
jgi:hypothetical protein